jgi:glycosyltransferase involved in cell wall biosynthesis
MPVPVLFHSQTLGYGGGERQLATMALALDRSRYTPHVAYQHPGVWNQRFLDAGIPLFQFAINSYGNAQAWREAVRFRRYLRDHRIRIVQGFDYTLNVFATTVARTVPGVIALSTQRCETKLIDRKYQTATRWVHRLASGVVVNSRQLEAQVREETGLSPDRIHVCGNGIDTIRFSPADPPQALTIGCVCVLREEKNLSLLLRAFQSLLPIHPHARLRIVGSGPEEHRLKQLATELKLGGACEFLPATTDVPAELRQMSIFVLPSVSEGLSNALMEAMACGCVPVAADLPSNGELIGHQQEGLLFANNDQKALEDTLSQLLGNPAALEQFRSAARTKIEKAFSIHAATARLQAVYDRLLG